MLNINTVNFNVEGVTRRDEKSRHEIFSQVSVRAVSPFAHSEPSYFLSALSENGRWALSLKVVRSIAKETFLPSKKIKGELL